MEAHNLPSCTYLPPNGVFFKSIVLYDTRGLVNPFYWVPVDNLKACGSHVQADSPSYVYLYDTVQSVPPPPPPPPSVSVGITGPSRVPAHRYCTWTATASGGATPYAYSWLVNGNPAGNDSSLAITTPSSGFTISVVAVDSIGRANGQDLHVNVGGVNNCNQQLPIGK